MKYAFATCVFAALAMMGPGRAIADGSSGSAPAEGGDEDSGDVLSGVSVNYETRAPDPKQEGGAPQIRVEVIGGPRITNKDKFALRDVNQKPPIELHATAFDKNSNDTIAVAIVLCTWEMFAGNDEVQEVDDASKKPGILTPLKQALDQNRFTDLGVGQSLGELVTYADTPHVKYKMGALKGLTTAMFGEQKEYFGTQGRDMVAAIRMAMGDLHVANADHKILIVIGDGTDTDNEKAKGALAQLKVQADKDNMQVYAITYKVDGLSDKVNPITSLLGPNNPMQEAKNAGDIATAIADVLRRMNDRYYLTFPGYDDKTETGLVWDQKEHTLQLRIDKSQTEQKDVTLSPPWAPPKKSSFPWWIVFTLGGLVLVVGVFLIARKKPAPEPLPAPVVAVAAPAPSNGPMKTVMIGVGGDQDGFPIVGWLVPINGQNAYQTYRLKPGLTKIGTTHPADIVVADGFMSTDHCQITVSPNGFTLIDGGSTNGSYVNDRRVQRHDLVDNDLLTFGKTNFKFKSIN